MDALKSKITLQEDLLSGDDLRKRSAEFLRSLQVTVRKDDLANVEADAWEPLKSSLRDTFAAYAAQGISPSEGAFYMFAWRTHWPSPFRGVLASSPPNSDVSAGEPE